MWVIALILIILLHLWAKKSIPGPNACQKCGLHARPTSKYCDACRPQSPEFYESPDDETPVKREP